MVLERLVGQSLLRLELEQLMAAVEPSVFLQVLPLLFDRAVLRKRRILVG